MKTKILIYITKPIKEWLEKHSKDLGISKSELIRRTLDKERTSERKHGC